MSLRQGPTTVEEFCGEVCGRDFSGAVFENKDLRGCAFTHCNFSGASFPGTNLYGTSFQSCALTNTDFSRSFLFGAFFYFAKAAHGIRFPEAPVKLDDLCVWDHGYIGRLKALLLSEDNESISLLLGSGEVIKYPFWMKYTLLELVK